MPILKYKNSSNEWTPVPLMVGLSDNTIQLPALSNPASNSDVALGKEYIDANGNKQTGTGLIGSAEEGNVDAITFTSTIDSNGSLDLTPIKTQLGGGSWPESFIAVGTSSLFDSLAEQPCPMIYACLTTRQANTTLLLQSYVTASSAAAMEINTITQTLSSHSWIVDTNANNGGKEVTITAYLI